MLLIGLTLGPGTAMQRSSALILAGWFAVLPFVISCASSPTVQLPPTPDQGTAKAVGSDYVIGPGDTLQVFVWRNPELTVTVPVRPDGKISTPLVEDMVAVGKNPPTLARDIEQVLSQYIRSPQGNVIVTQPLSVFIQIAVV